MERTGILQFMKNCLDNLDYNREISDNLSLMAAMESFLLDLHKHYGFTDTEKRIRGHSSHHQLRFSLLYIEKNDMSYDEIAEETFVNSIEAFKYYVRFCNQVALETVIEDSYDISDYKVLLKEYEKNGL